MRDAICTLEKCASYSTDLNINNVLESLGNYSYNVFFDLINSIIDGNEATVINIIEYFYNQGNDLKLFVDNFFSFCLEVSKYSIFKSMDVVTIPNNLQKRLDDSVNFDNAPKYYAYVLDKLLNIKQTIKGDNNLKSTIIVMFLQMARCT